MTKEIKVNESYESFKNIDCFENACVVLDNMIRVLEDEKNMNIYWKKILTIIPDGYYKRDAKADKKEEVLYFVCSNAFYLDELFEKAEDEEAIFALNKCEQECC